MKRIVSLALLVWLASGCWAALAADVKMNGDATIMATERTTFKTAKTSEPLTLQERLRLRTDFKANDDLKFRLGIRVNNKGQFQNTGTMER